MAERKRPKSPLNHEPEAVTWAREKSGLTMTEVAARLGVSLSLVSEIEKGTRNATPAMLLRLAEVLNCPVVVIERKRIVVVPKAAALFYDIPLRQAS
jgi:transcriptional regulator with XRE-family HTH domain